ncbi:TcmI family type II polyketide cyclase [Planosporangium sp. 12N6]|uniref:TcmI family type II polyketide cyclase n=1 Tax=Planosporangium spinosum TaxID=3402278 RepID=UPI003CEBFF76
MSAPLPGTGPAGTHRTLIVARMKPESEGAVAEIFARSDRTDLPRLVGVRSRTLFRFHDLYMHLIEADSPVGPAVDRVRDDALFRRVNEELSAHIDPYDPATWRGPADAMATEFYRWESAR